MHLLFPSSGKLVAEFKFGFDVTGRENEGISPKKMTLNVHTQPWFEIINSISKKLFMYTFFIEIYRYITSFVINTETQPTRKVEKISLIYIYNCTRLVYNFSFLFHVLSMPSSVSLSETDNTDSKS